MKKIDSVTLRSVLGAVCGAAVICAAASLGGCQNAGNSQAPAASDYQTGHALGDLVGAWEVTGWSAPAGGDRRPLTGRANAVREKNYFVRIELSCSDSSAGGPVEGTCLFAQQGGLAVELSTWSSSSPAMRRFEGTMSPDGKLIVFSQTQGGGDRSMKLLLNAPMGWDVEVWSDGRQVESYSFRKARK